MAHRSDAGREPLRQPSSPGQPLTHRMSNISDISYAEPSSFDPTQPTLHGRPSMVSLDSYNSYSPAQDLEANGQSYGADSSWLPSRPSSGTYAPMSYQGAGPPSRAASTLSRLSSLRRPARGPSDAEEIDLALLSQAAPIGAFETVPEEEPLASVPSFDVTATLGPSTRHDEEFIKKLQEQEASGTLTGGLGQGFKPDSRLRDDELLSSPVSVSRNLSRSFTRRKPSRNLGRKETIRHMGQDAANRRGEVIEVILEEPAGADISALEGPSTMVGVDSRRNTQIGQKTEVFYPQNDWKPFSMQWPWLLMLILVSIALAVMQELLFQKFKKDPLLKFKSPEDVDPGMYFAVKFAPTLFAVVYGVLWQFTDFEVRRLEAYYQLSKQGGALAAESINVDYVTSFSFFRPIRALRVGHYAVALSSIATILAISLVPTFAAAAVVLTPGRKERMDHPEHDKILHFDAVFSRLLTATLCLCATLGVALFYLLQTRRTGLLTDVRGIAGLASMAVVSHILMDFKDMDNAKHHDIHHKLKSHRYTLRNSSLAPDDDNPVTSQEREKYKNVHFSENPHPLMLRPVGSIPFIVGLILFMGFIPTFLFTPADIITDKAPWVITALAVCLKLLWNALETAVRMMEPYYILSRRHAPSKTLTLDYTALPFGYLPIRALFNGHILVFLVGFGSVMTEFLTIFVTGLATVDGKDFLRDYTQNPKKGTSSDSNRLDSGTETVMSFYVSFAFSVFILLYMSAVSLIVFLRRRHPFVPRQPNTIASVLAYIHQSKMLYTFVGTTRMSTTEMVRKLDDGSTYGLGWFEGRDGHVHCGVDQEELTSNYKHGIDFSMGNRPWDTRWDVL